MIPNLLRKLQKRVLMLLLLLTLVPANLEATDRIGANTTLSIEGSYFHPRRSKFRNFYGNGFPALSVRFDKSHGAKTWFSVIGRFLKMSKIDNLNFFSISGTVLLKRQLYTVGRACYYVAAGPQLDLRIVRYSQNIDFTAKEELIQTQTELSPSVALEAGIDTWVSDGIRLSPHVSFNYTLPFGDPTRGDLGDTGGFAFALGLGLSI